MRKEAVQCTEFSTRSVTGGGRFLFENPVQGPEDLFLEGLLELQYNTADLTALKRLASRISWAKGWPHDSRAFWNAEAFMWQHKISKKNREIIEQELSSLCGKKNLDLGCGAHSYLPSVGFDLSPKMLDFNANCYEKVKGSVEEKLPFADDSFDSATAVFLLNYVQNYQQLLQEIRRALREKGIFVMVLSSTPVNEWQRQKEVNSFEKEKWQMLLHKSGFVVKLKEEKNLCFFWCRKQAQSGF